MNTSGDWNETQVELPTTCLDNINATNWTVDTECFDKEYMTQSGESGEEEMEFSHEWGVVNREDLERRFLVEFREAQRKLDQDTGRDVDDNNASIETDSIETEDSSGDMEDWVGSGSDEEEEFHDDTTIKPGEGKDWEWIPKNITRNVTTKGDSDQKWTMGSFWGMECIRQKDCLGFSLAGNHFSISQCMVTSTHGPICIPNVEVFIGIGLAVFLIVVSCGIMCYYCYKYKQRRNNMSTAAAADSQKG